LKVKQSGERGLTSNEDLYGFNLIQTRVQPDQVNPKPNRQSHVPLIQEPQGQFMVNNGTLQQNMQNPANLVQNLQQIQNALQFPNMLPNIANQQQSQQLTAIQQQLSAFMNLFQQQALPSMDYRSMPIFNHINPAVMQIPGVPGVPNPSVPNPVVPNPAVLNPAVLTAPNAVVPNLMNSTPISSPSKLPMPARLQNFNHELTSSFSRENIADLTSNLPEKVNIFTNKAASTILPNTTLKYFNTNLPSSDIQNPEKVQHSTVSESKTSSMQIDLTDDFEEDDDEPFFGEPSIDENTEVVTGDFCQDLFKYLICDEWREAVIKMNQFLEIDSLQKFLQFNFDQLKREMAREMSAESTFSMGEILTLKFCQNEYKMNKMKGLSEVK